MSDMDSKEKAMALIVWNKQLETGNGKIDEQHKALVEAFNKLHTAMKQGKGKDELGNTLNFLANYTVQHFQMEEQLMNAHQYPGSATHKGLHKDLVGKVADLVTKYNAGQAMLTMQVMDFLEGWLIEHIQGEDRRLADHLRTKGIS
jgi:hemerythrin-like metal-binding protein